MPTINAIDVGMIWDITTLTLVHTVISIVAIAAGLVVVGGLIAGVRIDGWTGSRAL